MTVLNIVLPIFLVIGLGYALRRLHFITTAGNTVLTRLVFYVAAPVLLVRGAAGTDLRSSLDPRVLGVFIVVSVLVAAVTYALAFRSRPSRRGVFAQGAHRSNMVFVGLPLVMNAFGEEAVGQVAVLVGAMVVVYNVLSIVVLTLPHHSGGSGRRVDLTGMLKRIAVNPLALGSVGGIILSATGIGIPHALGGAMDLVGGTALPLALVSVGAGLDLGRLRRELPGAATTCALKLGLYPALVYFGLRALGLEGIALQAPVLLAATPTAVVSYVMAQEMQGDEQLAGAMVIGTTLLSLPTSILWLLLLGV
jgi:predicted permease